MIQGVVLKSLLKRYDDRGFLYEIMRRDESMYLGFGQAYISAVNEGVVKAWHLHRVQIDNLCCVKGLIKVVLWDGRKDSLTFEQINEFFIGEENLQLLQIPNGVLHGWQGKASGTSLVLNIPTEVYNYAEPDEYRIHPHINDINYDWRLNPDG